MEEENKNVLRQKLRRPYPLFFRGRYDKMYCPKAGEEISPQVCAKWQDDNCADCEYFEPFI